MLPTTDASFTARREGARLGRPGTVRSHGLSGICTHRPTQVGEASEAGSALLFHIGLVLPTTVP